MTTVWDDSTSDLRDLVSAGAGYAFAQNLPTGRATETPFREINTNGQTSALSPFVVGMPQQAADFLRYDGVWLRPWVNDPTRAVWDEKTQLWYAWVITNGNEDFVDATWGEIVSPDLVNWVDNGYRFYTNNNDMGTSLWGGSVVIDENNTAGFGAGAALYFITMPGGTAESSQQCTTRWVAPSLGCAPVFDKIVQVNNGPSNDPNNPVRAPGMDFRDTRVDWDDDHNQWVLKITVGYGVAFYTSQDTETWTFLSVIDLSAWQQIETPDMVPMVADDGTKKWVLAFSMKTWNGQSRQLIGYMTGSWDGKTFTPDSPTPNLLCEGPDFYANALFQKDGVTYAWGWMMNWEYAGDGGTQGYNNSTTSVLQLGLTYEADAGVYRLTYAPLRKQFFIYPDQNDYWSGDITAGTSWTCPLATLGNTFQYHVFITTRPQSSSQTTEITIDTGMQGSYYTRLILNVSKGTYTFQRSNSGSIFFGYGDTVTAYNADVTGSIESNAARYYIIFLWDGNGVEIIVNNKTYICANVYLPDGLRGMQITNTGSQTFSMSRTRVRY